jgi:phage antirepressor YoqD-like protein
MNDIAARDDRVLSLLQQAREFNTLLVAEIERLSVPAQLGQAVMDDGQCYTFSQAAKMLSPKLKEETGEAIGQNILFAVLRDIGILQSSEAHRNEPKQQFITYFKLVPKETPVGIRLTPLFTGKGLAWVFPKLLEYYR